MKKVTVPVTLDQNTYDKMDRLCEELGLDPDTAFSIFAAKMVNEQSMPFEVTEKELPQDGDTKAKVLKIAGIVAVITSLALCFGMLAKLIHTMKGK